MADDELIDPSSENVVDDTPPFDQYFYEDARNPEEGDLVTDFRDETVYGFDPRFRTELDQQLSRSESTGNLTNLDGPQLQALFNRLAVIRESAFKQSLRDPYEFRIRPISGNNAVGLPKDGFLLPLPPEKFDMSFQQDPRSYVAINQQEYTLPGAKRMAEIMLEGMFPWATRFTGGWGPGGKPNYLPGYITTANFTSPAECVRRFLALMKSAQPFYLTVGPPPNAPHSNTHPGGLVGTGWKFTVTSFEYGEAFGHPGSYVFAMTLRQWIPTYPPRNKTNNTTSGTTQGPVIKPPQDDRPKVKVYTIRSGDTLWDISARFLGSGTRWPQIYSLNRKVIEDECKRRGSSCYPRGWHIWPGTKLKIPNKSRDSA